MHVCVCVCALSLCELCFIPSITFFLILFFFLYIYIYKKFKYSMSTVGILGRTVLNTALGSRQGQEEVSLQNRAWGRIGRRAEQARGQPGTAAGQGGGHGGGQQGRGLQGSSSKGNSRTILLLLENETNVNGVIPCIQRG